MTRRPESDRRAASGLTALVALVLAAGGCQTGPAVTVSTGGILGYAIPDRGVPIEILFVDPMELAAPGTATLQIQLNHAPTSVSGQWVALFFSGDTELVDPLPGKWHHLAKGEPERSVELAIPKAGTGAVTILGRAQDSTVEKTATLTIK